MEVKEIKKDPCFEEPGAKFADIFSDDTIGFSKIKAVKGKPINISCEHNGIHDEIKIKHILYIISGQFKVTVLTNDHLLNQGDSLAIIDPPSYNILCLEDGEMIFLTTGMIEETFDTKTLDAFNEKLESYDPYTNRHNQRVGLYSGYLANSLLPDEDSSYIHYAAIYHDVGKINIPKEILNKPRKLTPEEYELIKKHPLDSYEMIKPVFGEKIAEIARHHHEMIDGSGYPDHLKGKEVSIQDRILAVADVFDALTSDRSYRKGYSFKDALNIIDTQFKGRLDPKVVEKLKELIQKNIIVKSN
jgi:HD-GYP domain-containing protein (c-di-GMP phosphodiesterase class II)